MSLVSQLKALTPKKVVITGYSDSACTAPISVRVNSINYTELTLPLNPENLSSTYLTNFIRQDRMPGSGQAQSSTRGEPEPTYVPGSPARTLQTSFMLDETLPEHRMISVQECIEVLEGFCTSRQSGTGEHTWIKMQWGEIKYKGLVNHLHIQQTLFNRTGAPIQARVDLTLTRTTLEPVATKGGGFDIPSIPILESTPLSALLALIGASAGVGIASDLIDTSNDYIQVASENGLDSLNDLPSGGTLIAGE
ncbi:hypothetical protein P8971_23620 [Serratia marcescens]|uniref:CIS tube protein n=1 Tax=Serratia marcescens TaxID=615 RepID=UPI003204646E